MDIKVPRFSWSLARNFLLSTFIPIALITIIIANAYGKRYTDDVSTLVSTTLETTSRNLSTYLLELEQASLMPYYNETFFTTLGEIRENGGIPNTLDRIHLEDSVGNLLSFSQYTRDDIVGTLIVNGNVCLFNTTSLIDCSLNSEYLFSQTDWYQRAAEGKGEAIFLPPNYMDYYIASGDNFTNPQVISIVRAIVNIRTREPLCVIKIDANTTTFDSIFQEINWHVPSMILITDADDQLVYCNRELDAEAIGTIQTDSNIIQYQDSSYYIYHQQESSNQWNVYLLLDKSAIDGKSNYIYAVAIILYLLGLLIATGLYLLYSRKMVNTVNTIHKMAAEIQAGNYHGEYYFAKNNGLQIVIDSVTYITSLLHEKIETEYQLTLQQKSLQLKALRAQINPHFLFNTLNGLIALNQIGKSEELERSLFALTHLLRYTLSEDADTTIEEEMKFLNDYCMLQKLRFGRRLNYNINFTPSLGYLRIPRLIFQPLVENAVIHGIEPSQQHCHLDVAVTDYKDSGILVTIEDDGVGFDVNNTPKHIGIENVQKRILLLDPENCFNIESIPGEGTVITIIMKVEKHHEISDR